MLAFLGLITISLSIICTSSLLYLLTGADPGFPVGGFANPRVRGGGLPTYDFAKFCEKLHEIEKILGH